ncbi:MAG TPA: metallophosphoesterase [Ignavibacteria bacterium]
MNKKLQNTAKRYIAVIGDIHGCYNTLMDLYKKICKFPSNIYCVGDVIDRGINSRRAVQFLIDKKIKSVIGNHEHWFLDTVNYRQDISYFRKWVAYGGDSTVESYMPGDTNTTIKDFIDEVEHCGHYEFISHFPLKYEINNVIVSHAGIIKNGDEKSIYFNSETPLKIDDKLQIFGHTAYQEVQYIPNWYASIDTGCVFGYKLSAVIVDTVKAEIAEIIESPYSE